MDRERALSLVRLHLHHPNLIKHSLATEAVMKGLAEKLGEDQEKWGLAGLLHDLDAEQTENDLAAHTHETVRILRDQGVDEEIIEAIRLHNEAAHGDRRSSVFHHALAAGETITGLITATALVYPDKKLASVKPKSVTKRYKERAFAAGADREIIAECGKLGMELGEFSELCLRAMQGIADELGL
ncbi:MAG: HDIG domain-containing protein [Desulfuromonadaceae bacterium]|nr:HDIG domain-containing protein [Desulfuromonadaceae bacterium]